MIYLFWMCAIFTPEGQIASPVMRFETFEEPRAAFTRSLATYRKLSGEAVTEIVTMRCIGFQ
jgi:hypothetical protein